MHLLTEIAYSTAFSARPILTVRLICHPEYPCPAVDDIRAELARSPGGGLELCYVLAGDMARLLVPPPTPAGPADELWRHTCCEAFVAGDGNAYREFNFSPSGRWAVYDFAGYRQRNGDWTPDAGPSITLERLPDRLELTARIPAALLPPDVTRLGLTAVIETTDGSLSYWSLAHPGEKPDFHRREGFTLQLAAGK